MDEKYVPPGKADYVYGAMPIEALGLNARAVNSLRRGGYSTLAQMMNMTIRDFLNLRSAGATTLGHVLTTLDEGTLESRVEALENAVRELQEGK